MSFSINRVDVSCDVCGMETEPVELGGVVGGFTLDPAREELRRDGWLVEGNDLLTCPDCQSEPSDD